MGKILLFFQLLLLFYLVYFTIYIFVIESVSGARTKEYKELGPFWKLIFYPLFIPLKIIRYLDKLENEK